MESDDMVFVFILGLIFVACLFLEKKLKEYLVRCGLFLVEFPIVDRKIVSKFETFDRYLGWSPKETENHPDNTGSYLGFNRRSTFYSIDRNGSRTFRNYFEKCYISTFGDSFAMCRQVNDDETFQYFLSQKTKSFVANYGVGGYGLDQALLRLESLELPIETRYICMFVTPWTVERMLACWKHYIEPGNILGAKPRFICDNGELKLIENFVRCKDDFKNLKTYRDFLHKNDGNFPFFSRKLKHSPKTALGYLFSRKDLLNYLLAFYRFKNLKNLTFERFLQKGEAFIVNNLQEECEYLQELYRKHFALLEAVLKRFVNFCKNKTWTPFFVMLPSFFHIKFMLTGNDLYRNEINSICKKNNLSYLDMFDFWNTLEESELEKCFVDIYGHHSAIGNQYVSEIIYEKFFASNF